jgi:hypothetical protein
MKGYVFWDITLSMIIYEAARLESGSNPSTAALQVVGGDEKGTQYLGDINKGAWPAMLRESQI